MDEDIKNFIRYWNIKYPIDFWWRRKYNIPFNSKKHRKQSMLDMKIEFEEDRMYEEEMKKSIANDAKPKYLPGRGMLFEKGDESRSMTDEEVDEAYDKIDIGSIEENGDEILV